MTEWVTISEAAKEVGLTPAAIRYWCNFKGLESRAHEPDFGHNTTLVNINDVREMMEKRK